MLAGFITLLLIVKPWPHLKLYGKINTEVEKTGASALLGVKASEEKLKSDKDNSDENKAKYK